MSAQTTATDWEAVIGLEVHVELSTRTKMFCACPTAFGGEANTHTCETCLGQPGALPVINRSAVEAAIRLGLALGSEIAPWSQFHRKNYFYPDMPKDYQISQYDVPICSGGELEVVTDGGARRIGITRVHMEEDTGKSFHVGTSGRIHGAEYSLIDYNRAGIPLLEVVSEPDVRTAEEAQAYLAELRGIVLALGISDAKLEEGSMRCDANISVRARDGELGTRAEVKNLNSIRSLGRAVSFEIARQIDVLESGGRIVQETRHWDEAAGVTSTLRKKEATEDYRYFPDPDLVPVEPSLEWIEEIRASLPELPAARRQRLAEVHGLDAGVIATLESNALSDRFEEAVQAGAPEAEAANWLTNEVVAWASEHAAEPVAVAPSGSDLAELCGLVADGTLSKKLAREVLDDVLAGKGSPKAIAADRGLEQISDEGELAAIIDQVIADNPKPAQQVRDGNAKAIGALVGAVMKATRGKANPQLANQLLNERLIAEG